MFTRLWRSFGSELQFVTETNALKVIWREERSRKHALEA